MFECETVFKEVTHCIGVVHCPTLRVEFVLAQNANEVVVAVVVAVVVINCRNVQSERCLYLHKHLVMMN